MSDSKKFFLKKEQPIKHKHSANEQSRGDYRLGDAPPPKKKKFKFWGSEMPFPALSTGHFNKYERKSKWLEYILPISNVVVKVHCLRNKGKTVTPSRKLQAKGKIACMQPSLLVSTAKYP